MKQKLMFLSNKLAFGVLIIGLLFFVSGCEKKDGTDATAANKKVNWKMASTFSGTLPILGDGGVHFADKVREISSGRVDIKFFDPGKLVPALEVFDATSEGAIDAAWSAAGYWIGKVPSSAFFSAVRRFLISMRNLSR